MASLSILALQTGAAAAAEGIVVVLVVAVRTAGMDIDFRYSRLQKNWPSWILQRKRNLYCLHVH